MATRKEKDALGEREVPADAYWGIQTLRAMENFPISGARADRELIKAYGLIKAAAARVNHELGLLDEERSSAIAAAAGELAAGALDAEIVVDAFQAGAGTSVHMNVNEVLRSRANEIQGRPRGDGGIHPNDHVNMGQSTNDTFPTALRMACAAKGKGLGEALGELEAALQAKAGELDLDLTAGRTHLQDAVPIRYGQVFAGYAAAIGKARAHLEAARQRLHELPIGGTAVGTGLNSHPEYAARVCAQLAAATGEPFRRGDDWVELMSSMGDLERYSAALRSVAIEAGRIASDLRLLCSGPHSGMGDLELPAVQPGSSIMPGKVNPSMAEMLNQVCFQVLGNDHAVALAAQAGQLQLNVMMPGMAFALLTSLGMLTNALQVFTGRCVAGISVDRDRIRQHVDGSAAMATILNPIVGYAAAAELTKEALGSGRRVTDLIVERGILSRAELDRLLDPRRVTSPGA